MINDLKPKQAELDQFIYDTHNIKADDVFIDKVIALENELSEFANEVGFFKYWKGSHKPNWDDVLEEYSDCIHFAVGLSNDLKIDIQYTKPKQEDIRVLYLGIKNMVTILPTHQDIYNQLFSAIWYLGQKLGFSEQDIREAYERKYQINIERQQNSY